MTLTQLKVRPSRTARTEMINLVCNNNSVSNNQFTILDSPSIEELIYQSQQRLASLAADCSNITNNIEQLMERQQQIIADPFGTVERYDQEISHHPAPSNILNITNSTEPSFTPPVIQPHSAEVESVSSNITNISNNPNSVSNGTHIPTGKSSSKRKKKKKKKKQKSTSANNRTRLPKAQQLITSLYSGELRPSLQQHHGDRLREKETNTTRILLNNPNGIYCSAEAGKTHILIDNILQSQTDIFVAPESHVKPGSDGTKTISELFQSRIPNCTITHSNTRSDRLNSDNTQAGGVTTFISPDLTRKIGVIRQEPLGRWHTHEIFTQKGICVVYSFYRVNPGSTNNPHSAYSLLLEYHKQNPKNKTPDKQAVIDIVKAIKKDLAKGRSIMILADANESHAHVHKDYLTAMDELGLINGLERKFGHGNIPPTHRNSRQGIDHFHYTPDIHNMIKSIGILPMNEFCPSDHCGIYADIDNTQLLAPTEELITFYDRRRLKSPNIKNKYAYLEWLSSQIEHQGINDRIEHLRKLINDTESDEEEIKNLIDSLDKQIHEIMMAAEKNLPGVHTMFWTPEVTTKLKELYGINKEIKQLKAKTKRYQQNNRHRLHELNDRRNSIKEWFTTRASTAEDVRQDFLDELAKDLVKRGKFKEEAVAVKCLKHIEKQKSESKILSSILKPFKEGGLTYILVPGKGEYPVDLQHLYMDPDTIWARIERDQGKDIDEWVPITLKEDMERLLISFQKLHFQQAQNTPLATPEWIDRLKHSSTQDILSALNNDDTLTPPTKALVEEILQKPEEEPTFDVEFNDFKKFIEGKDERTSASPSGRHYGHYKSIINHDMLFYIFEVICASVSISYIPKRWRHTVTTLVAKDPEPYIHRLRPIHIIEPEMQFISNHFWTKVFMRQCEKLGLITDAQYGGRKGRQPQNAIIKQQLIWDIIKLKNKNATSHLADARANFDRNMSHIVGKALVSMNMDPQIMQFYQLFLEKQTFAVKSTYGTTRETYCFNKNNPHFGDGQGIGWSSVNQIVISSIIDSVYNAIAPMFCLKSFDDLHTILSGINFFIDDRISNTLADSHNVPELVKKFQINENLQVDLLNATGGAIAPKKCVWWLLQKDQGNLHFKYNTKNLHQHKFKLKNTGDDHWYDITMLQPDEAEKYLGAWIGPEMNPKKQIKKLEQKIGTWSKQLLSRRVPALLIPRAYTDYLKPSIAHPLVACDLTFEEADRLMRKIRMTLNEKTRYHSRTALAVQHGPIDLLGEALLHIFDIAGEEKLAFLFAHLRKNQNEKLHGQRDTVAEAIFTSLKDHQLWLGHFDLLFNTNFDEWQPLLGTRSWIISIWRYVCYRSLHIDLNEVPFYELPAENDFFLMKYLHDRINNITQKRMFNKVRVHYRLLTLSDIVDDTGKHIHPDLLNPDTDKFTARTSIFNWPDEEYIRQDWRDTFISILKDEIEPMLETNPLGAWIEGRTSHQQKAAIKLPNNNIVIDNKVYEETRSNQFKCIGETNTSHKGIPVDIKHTTNSIKLLPTLDPRYVSVEKYESDNIIENAPKYLQNVWGITKITSIDLEKLREILRHPFIIVSDGGCPPNVKYCTYAWAIAKTDGTIITMNGGAIGGLELDNDSFRAEGYGVFAGISFINYLHKNGFEIHPHWKQYCDNKTCTELEASHHIPTSKTLGKKAHYDVRVEVCHELQAASTPRSILKVKGHMDRVKPFHLCLPEEKVNILVDAHCGYIHRQIQLDPTFHPPLMSDFLPHQYISLSTTSSRLVKKSFMGAHEYDQACELTQYICEKHNIDDNNFHNIDWKALSTFSSSITYTQRRKYHKILHRKWITNRQLHLMKQHPNALCPLCSCAEDTFDHIMKCSHSCTRSAHEGASENFYSSLFDMETPDSLCKLFIYGIQHDYVPADIVHSTLDEHPYLKDSLLPAVNDQNRIGWTLALSGLLSRSWGSVIKAHFDFFAITQRRVETWMRKCVGVFFEYAHTIWTTRTSFLAKQGCLHLTRFKEECRDLHKHLCRTPWKLGQYRYHLDKSQSFFDLSTQKTLELWKYRVDSRVKEVERKAKVKPKHTLPKLWKVKATRRNRKAPRLRPQFISRREIRARKEKCRQALLQKIRRINNYFRVPQIPLFRPHPAPMLDEIPVPRPPPAPDPPDPPLDPGPFSMGFTVH